MTASRRILTLLVAVLVAVQALWSGLGATAYAAGIDEARFMCAKIALPVEARAQLAELAALIDGEPAPVFDSPDCPSCAFAKAQALPALMAASPGEAVSLVRPALLPALVLWSPRQPTGPPVGLRAPPISA